MTPVTSFTAVVVWATTKRPTVSKCIFFFRSHVVAEVLFFCLSKRRCMLSSLLNDIHSSFNDHDPILEIDLQRITGSLIQHTLFSIISLLSALAVGTKLGLMSMLCS
jgi:hypothetical protein